MRTPVPDYLRQVLRQCSDNTDGALADYIPELANVDPERFAVALCMGDGKVYAAGDSETEFTNQSMSKPFVYALALRDRGLAEVQARVGVEPSGDPFNEMSLGEDGRPSNPMINSGAIATHSLIGGPEVPVEDKFELIRRGLSAFAGRELGIDEAVFESEFATSSRNMAFAHMLRHHGMVEQTALGLVRGYTLQCSVKVTVRDLAVMAVTLGMGGRNPITGEQVVPEWVSRQVLSVMMTCGMYDAAGDWMTGVGIPAKSGVSGGILGALPGQVGLAAFSPKIDRHGNSVRGVRVFERLSGDLNLHLMGIQEARVRLLLSSGDVELDDGTAHHLRLQGALYFGSVEQLFRDLDEVPEGEAVVVDLTKVTYVNPVGRRMLLDGMRGLGEGSRRLILVDPDGVLSDPTGSGVDMSVVSELSEA
ncbi:MAG: glutaminase [Propionibacterium sp.]|nr:glutaminase [Propionibacterium sp.]